MESTLKPLACFAAIILATSCSDDEGAYVCNSCVSSPQALSANDGSGKGIYKGIMLGSTGTIMLNIANNDETISGIMFIDGKRLELYSEGVYNQGFDYYIHDYISSVVIRFQVNSDGTSYGLTVSHIDGHDDVSFALVKEYSTELVKGFEGTFSGDSEGTLNLLVVGNEWAALSRPDGETSDEEAEFSGEIVDGELICDCGDVTVDGTLSGDNISGTWVTPVESGTWKARRTL